MKPQKVRHLAIALISVLAVTGLSPANIRAQDSVAYWAHRIEVPPNLGGFAVPYGPDIKLVTTNSGSGPMTIGNITTAPLVEDDVRLLYVYDHAGCINPDSTYADSDPNSPYYDPDPTPPIPGKVWTLNELVGPVWLGDPQLNSSRAGGSGSNYAISSTGLVVGYVYDSAVDLSGSERRKRPVYLDLTDPILELKLVPNPFSTADYADISEPRVNDAGDIHIRATEHSGTNRYFLYRPARNGEPAESILLPDLGVSFTGINALRQLVAHDRDNDVIIRYTVTDSAGNGIIDEIPAKGYRRRGNKEVVDWALDDVEGLNNFGAFTAKLYVYGERDPYIVRYGGLPGNLVEERRIQPPLLIGRPNSRPNDSGDSVGRTHHWRNYYFHEGSPADGDEILFPSIEDLIVPESDPDGSIATRLFSTLGLSNRDSTGYGWMVGTLFGETDGYDGPGTDAFYILEPIVPSSEPEILVNPIAGLITTEAGNTANFDVVLNTEPSADVTIGISSSNTDEGLLEDPDNPSGPLLDSYDLVFDATNWDQPQTVTVVGQGDDIADGNNATYTIITDPVISDDNNYTGLDAEDVQVTNLDPSSSATYSTLDEPNPDPPIGIPDNDPEGISSTIADVADFPFIALTLTLDIDHPRPSDLQIWLYPDPNSADPPVVYSGDNVNLNGDNNVSSDFTSTQGTWTLEVFDTKKKKTGTLYGWSITVDY